MQTCPCNVVYPRIPHNYIVKLGFAEEYLCFFFVVVVFFVLFRCFFLFLFSLFILVQKHINVLSNNIQKKKKKIKPFPIKISIFASEKILCIFIGKVS